MELLCSLSFSRHFLVAWTFTYVWTMAHGLQRIVEEPEDTRGLRGDTITLRCRVEGQEGPVTWIKDGFALGSDRDLVAYERYSMVGSGADGEYNLQIKNVDLSDDATYQCQLLQTSSAEGKISRAVRLTVLVAPSPPQFINSGDMITAVESREFTIGCVAERGKPPATISWVVSATPDGANLVRTLGNLTEEDEGTSSGSEKSKKTDGEKKKKKKNGEKGEGKEEGKEVEEEQRDSVREEVKKEDLLFTVRSYLRYTPQPRDDGKYLVCLVRHEAVEAKMATAAQLVIEYAPKVTVFLNSTGLLREGGQGTLVCDVDAKPSNSLQYAWRKDGNIIPWGHNKHVLQLTEGDLRRENQGSVYECEVLNTIGTTSADFILEMEYPPIINIREKQVPADVGETKTLRCEVDSNPPANMEWLRKGSEYSVLSREENYTLANVKNWQAGVYVCKATAPGFPAVKEEVELHIKGVPEVIMASTVAAEGDEIEIICKVRGFPRPDSIRWLKGDKPIHFATNGRFSQRQMPQKNAILNILTITKPQSGDYTSYKCEARNSRGTGSGETRMVTSNPIPLYVLIPGVIGGCVGIILVILCCIVCNRKTCASKTTTISDDHSDVTVKVEALDGSGMAMDYFPDMYGSHQPLENGYSGKDYIPLPQDNPDVDLLPPPYSSYVHTPPSSIYGNHSPSTFLPPPQVSAANSHGNGMVHMTYLADTDPNRHPSNYNVYTEYADYAPADRDYQPYYAGLSNGGLGGGPMVPLRQPNHIPPAPGSMIMAQTHNNNYPHHGGDPSGAYYPMINGGGPLMAPLATLEPVQEVTTPEENSLSASASEYRPVSSASGAVHAGSPARSGTLGSRGNLDLAVTSSAGLGGLPQQHIVIPRVQSDGSTHV